MLLIWVVIFLFLIYSILIIYYWRGWESIPSFLPSTEPSTSIAVIIPARNEEENISILLQSLRDQNYPGHLFEVIVIDDHSTDNTAKLAAGFPGVTVISLQEENINSYKKKAIGTGIANAKAELIVTTDADCIPTADWLRTIAAFRKDNNAEFIAGPVVFNCNNSVLQIFQAIDFMVLQGITGAAVSKGIHSMCNGANLAYTKEIFNEVKGFEGIDDIASGDDMLLMHKIWKLHPEKVRYLKSADAIVQTQPMRSWKEFLNQRIRWASKASKYDDKRIFWVLLLVYLFNLSLVALLVVGFWNVDYWLYFLIFIVLKSAIEFPFFLSLISFFNKPWADKIFIFFQPLHVVYTVVSGLLGQFGKYEWKGRQVK